MKDILGRLYNGFLLRDVLGYVVPGSCVFACLLHLLSVISAFPLDQFLKFITSDTYKYFFLIAWCYACGHFLSGIFFHSPIFGKMFKYSPKEILVDYPDMRFDQAWASHRFQYRNACEKIGDSTREHIERHAALLHFTGHFSAGILFSTIYICCLAVYKSSPNVLVYAIPLIIVFSGMFSHYRTILTERYHLERLAIKSVSNKRQHEVLLFTP